MTEVSHDSIDPLRRTLLMAAPTLLLGSALGKAAEPKPDRRTGGQFPKGFLWGAATAGHQIEGNNTNSDMWVMEHVKPTMFVGSSGDACDSLNRWREDVGLVKAMGLNTYRFSLEWSRIEPAEGEFSNAMLDYYAAIIDGCRERGLAPMVTFNHYTCPRWFAAKGGWASDDAPDLFARFCDRAARRLAANMAYATTLNEPNIAGILKHLTLPAVFPQLVAKMDSAAAAAVGSTKWGNPMLSTEGVGGALRSAHAKGYAAIKAVRPDLRVGVSIAIDDDQAAGEGSLRDQKRQDAYADWFEAIRANSDFVGVQNYTRRVFDDKGLMRPPAGTVMTDNGFEFYPEALGNSIRYAYEQTRKPVIVTENGLSAKDDTLRVRYIPAAIKSMKGAMDEGIPVLGYVHWSLLDNFEWMQGYTQKFGLAAVDATTFKRTPKPSAAVYAAIVKANAVG